MNHTAVLVTLVIGVAWASDVPNSTKYRYDNENTSKQMTDLFNINFISMLNAEWVLGLEMSRGQQQN